MAGVSIDPIDLSVYLAGKLSIPDNGIAFVGVDGFTLSGSLNIELNVGLGIGGLSPIDFATSFQGELSTAVDRGR